MNITPAQLILRGYAEKDGSQWQAFCLDLCLAAQGDTFEEARTKLESQIAEYLYDALAGEDKEYAGQLLSRRAPLKYWIKFYWYFGLFKIGKLRKDIKRIFEEPWTVTANPPYKNV